MAQRINKIRDHLSPSLKTSVSGQLSISTTSGKASPDDVVVVSAVRTPLCKARKGGLRETAGDALVSTVLTEALKRATLKPEDVKDICFGNVLNGDAAIVARIGQMCAGIPADVPLSTVNRQCSSGLQACMHVANAIKAGQYDIGIGGGFETMTKNKMGASVPELTWDTVQDSELAQNCMIPMGITSENVAERFGVSRIKQDEMALLSHSRASKAQAEGRFDAEIVPVKTTLDDEEVVISKDDGIRPGGTLEKLATLRPAFKPGGSTTAANSSQTTDGAAAVVFARRSVAEARGLPILGTLRSFHVCGVPPEIMGIGPAVAIPNALKQAGVTIDDIDVYEINEAFASQCVYCVEKLGIPIEKVNPNGGAIALGHPLGTTGARQIATLLYELKRTKKKLGVVSMCIGTGMGAAAVFEANV